MTNLFLTILDMSLTASYCILIVCAARLLLKKAPKIFSYLLWSVVAFRLLCPWSFESNFSLLAGIYAITADEAFYNSGQSNPQSNIPAGNSLMAEQPAAQSGDLNTTGNTGSGDALSAQITDKAPAEKDLLTSDTSALSEKKAAAPSDTIPSEQTKISATLLSILINVGSYIWITGVAIMITYCIFTFLHLKQRLRKRAKKCGSYNQIPIMTVAGLDTPFVLGFCRSVIYLPESLTEAEKVQCLAHEYTHIRRKDHFVKQFAFMICCVYWFHPLVWLAFYLMTKDMEMSCDELALKSNALKDRKAYSETLLNLSSKPGHFAGCPLAFGENNTKTRIKNIMNYKRPGFWVILFSVFWVVFFLFGLVSDPAENTGIPATSSVSSMNPLETAFPSAEQSEQQAEQLSNMADMVKQEELKEALRQLKAQRNSMLPELADKINVQIGDQALELQNLQARQISNRVPAEEMFPLYAVIASGSDADAVVTLNTTPEETKLQNGTYVEIVDYDGGTTASIRFNPETALSENVTNIPTGTVDVSQLNIDLPENTVYTYSYWIGKLWGNAFCGRDTLALRQMAAEKETFDAEYENFGWSSPWPWGIYQVDPDMDYTRSLAGDIRITYYAETSDPTVTVWKQTLSLANEKTSFASLPELMQESVLFSEINFYDSISTYEDFMNAYSGGSLNMTPTIFDFENNYYSVLMETLQKPIYTDPITALENYLHLENGVGEVIETGTPGEIYVRYTFTLDGNSVNVPMHTLSGSEEYWCIDYERLMKEDYYSMMYALELDLEKHAEILNTWTNYLNEPENNAFITTNFNKSHIDLDMLFYDSASFLENVPASPEEQLHFPDSSSEIRCHYTGKQLDDFLLAKMNLALSDILYTENVRSELMNDWFYLEAYDTYTNFGIKGDTMQQEIVCTEIILNNDGTISITYGAIPEQSTSNAWVAKGSLIMQAKSPQSNYAQPEQYYFSVNSILEGFGVSKEKTEHFSNSFLSFIYPDNWDLQENSSEDISYVSFSDTASQTDSSFRISQGEAWLTNFDLTEEDYRQLFSESYEKVEIHSLTNMEIDGRKGIKIEFTCKMGKNEEHSAEENTYYMVQYETVVGYASYQFLGSCPKELQDSYTPAFDSMISSVRFQLTQDAESLQEMTKSLFNAFFTGDEKTLNTHAYDKELEVFIDARETYPIPSYVIKGLTDVRTARVDDVCSVSCEFRFDEDDTYTYLTIDYIKTDDGWKVMGIGLES